MNDEDFEKIWFWSEKEMNRWRKELLGILKNRPCLKQYFILQGYGVLLDKIEGGELYNLDDARELFEAGRNSPYATEVSEEEAQKFFEKDIKDGRDVSLDMERYRYRIDCSKFISKEFAIQLEERLNIIDEDNEKIGEEWRIAKGEKGR